MIGRYVLVDYSSISKQDFETRYEGIDQYSSSCHRENDPHSCSVCPPSGCLCCEKGVGALVNMEPLKLYSSRALFGIDPHSGSVYPHSGC